MIVDKFTDSTAPASPRALRTRRKNTTDDESGVPTKPISILETPNKPIATAETTSTRRSTRRLSSDAVVTLTPSKVSTPGRRSIRLNSEDSNQSLIMSSQPPTFNRKKIPAPLIEEDESKTISSTPTGRRTSRIATRSTSQSPNTSANNSINDKEKRVASKSPDKNIIKSESISHMTPVSDKNSIKSEDKAKNDGDKSSVFIDLITPYKSTPKIKNTENDENNDTNISTLVLNDSTLAQIIPDDSILNTTISPAKPSPRKRLSVSLNMDETLRLNDTRKRSESERHGNNNTTILEAENQNIENEPKQTEDVVGSPRKNKSILSSSESKATEKIVDNPVEEVKSSPEKRKSSLSQSESKSARKSNEKSFENDKSFSKSWSQPVRRSQEGIEKKIDCFEKFKVSPQKESKNKSSSPRKSRTNVIEDSDEEDAEEAMEIDEDEVDEEPERHSLIDDEAEECDYEDSLDSEERQYLKDNEIPENGHEIGSEDSDCGDEEEDESNDSFVVDDDVVEHDDDDDEDDIAFIDESPEKLSAKKNRKRIVEPSDSSDDGANDSKSKTQSPSKTNFYQDTKLKHFNGTIENNLDDDNVNDKSNIAPNESIQMMDIDGPITESQMVHNVEATPLKNKIAGKTSPERSIKSKNRKGDLLTEMKAVIDEFIHVNELDKIDGNNSDSVEIDFGNTDGTPRKTKLSPEKNFKSSLTENCDTTQNENPTITQITANRLSLASPLASNSPKSSNLTAMPIKGILKTPHQLDNIAAQSTPMIVKSDSKSIEKLASKSLIELTNKNVSDKEENDIKSKSMISEKKKKTISESSDASVSQKKTPKRTISYNIPVEEIEKRINEILQKKEEEKKIMRQQTPKRVKVCTYILFFQKNNFFFFKFFFSV